MLPVPCSCWPDRTLGMKCGPLALTLPPWSLQADPHGLHSQKLLHPSLHHCPSIMRSDHLEAVQWALEPCNPPTSGWWRFASQDSRSMVKEERASVPLASPEVLPGSWSPRGSLIYPKPASFLGSQQDGLGETELKQIHVCFFLKGSKIGFLLSDSFGPQSISLFSPLTRAPFLYCYGIYLFNVRSPRFICLTFSRSIHPSNSPNPLLSIKRLLSLSYEGYLSSGSYSD